MLDLVKNNPAANICLASGGSPDLAYELFTKAVLDKKVNVSNIAITKLDEWPGIAKDSELSCKKYIRDRVVDPLNISNYISFVPDTDDVNAEVEKVANELGAKHIDLCILVFGINGHLGLNEPADYLYPYSHAIELTEETKTHPMLQGDSSVTSRMTIGMKEIIDSKRIILLMSGSNKKELYKKFIEKKIDTHLPASLLWLHDNVTIIVRNDQFGE